MRPDASSTPMPTAMRLPRPASRCAPPTAGWCRSMPTRRAHLGEVFAAAGEGDAAIGVKGISVPLKGRDGACYAAHVLPLTSGARRRAGRTYAAVAAVLIRKASIEAPSPPEAIAQHYGLTPTELRVLLANVQVGRVA